MDILDKNIEAIRKNNMDLALRLSGYNGEPVPIEQSRSGAPTFKYQGRLFHSSYDPVKEALLQADEILSRKPGWVLLFGFGCGHLAQALLKKGRKNIIAYEPSAEILAGAVAGCDLARLLSEVDVYDNLPEFLARVRCIDCFEDILCYSTNPYKAAFPRELLDFISKVNNAQTMNKAGVCTDISSRDKWVENYLENMKYFPACPPVDTLKGGFHGVPMIIAGAGPSLKKNAHLLKEAKGKAVIVAAITAYKPLLKYGVVPDFIIASEKVDLPEYFAYDENDLETRLILGDASHPDMFTRQVGGKFVFFSAYSALSQELARHWGSHYFPSIGGSVTTAALDIGVMFGCDPVIFVGQDLSFGEGATHAPGGVYVSQDIKIDREKGEVLIEEDYVTLKEKAKSRFNLLWLKGLDGKPVASKYDWVTFHQWFEDYMAHMKKIGNATRVLNATEGGAYIEGMEHVTLREALERHIREDLPIENIIRQAVAGRQAPDIKAVAASLESMQKGLKEMRVSADSIVKEAEQIRKSVTGGQAGPDAIKSADRIKRLEDKLFKDAEKSTFIWESLMTTTYKLKEYLRRREGGENEASVSKEIETISEAYRDVSRMCGRYAQVLWGSAEGLKKAQGSCGRASVAAL